MKFVGRLPYLQNMVHTEMMATHHTLQILTTIYQNKPAHISTYNLNALYLFNTLIKHPTLHNRHPDKTILESMVQMLHFCMQLTTLHKVRAHANINNNKQAYQLAKMGHKQDHKVIGTPFEHAHIFHCILLSKRLVAPYA